MLRGPRCGVPDGGRALVGQVGDQLLAVFGGSGVVLEPKLLLVSWDFMLEPKDAQYRHEVVPWGQNQMPSVTTVRVRSSDSHPTLYLAGSQKSQASSP